MGEMKKIGLIGCGKWGSNILRDLIALNCKVYVVDIDPLAAAMAVRNGAVDAFLKMSDLPECNGYVVAVPIPDLTKETFRLLQYKKPIFSEKTLCLSLSDYDRLKSSGGEKFIFVMHKWHYHPGIEALRLVAQSGEIGDLRELFTTRHHWVTDFHGGDVFSTLCVHDLTIIKHILGYIPKEIKYVRSIQCENGFPFSAAIVMGERHVAYISVNGKHCSKRSGVSIHGSKGSAELFNAYDDHITIRTDAGGEMRRSIDTTFPLFLELKEFVQYLEHGPKPRCGLQDAGEIAQVICKLKKAAGLEQ
jgi:predicted dehydrogenase